MTARRITLKERRELRRAKPPRTREVPHPFLVPAISHTVKPARKETR